MITDLAHEIWAAAQLAPGEGIVDGVARVEALLRKVSHPAITHCDNCGCDWLDNGLNPVGCPYCKQSADAKILVAERDALEAENERLRADAERYRLLRKGAVEGVAVVRGLGAMDYGMSAVIGTYSEEIDGDDLDAAIDAIHNHSGVKND